MNNVVYIMTSNLLCNFTDEDNAKCRANFSAYHLYTESKRKEYGSEFLIVRGVVEFSVLRKGGIWRIHKLNVECVYRL
ncbi:MAG: nuclear transport factor 2 family protein [Synergistaceae bacterium]|nr:nuclear transport factor 2 family protein [Synergistaceae bacterium]